MSVCVDHECFELPLNEKERRFLSFLIKYPRLKSFIKFPLKINHKEEFKRRWNAIWVIYKEYYDILSEEDIYRIIETTILEYGGNIRNIYTEQEIYTPEILRWYFGVEIRRSWYFKPEIDADNEIYRDHKRFKYF